LLSAAEQILIEQGVHALTVRRIGAVSGLNGTLITYHFGTVAGLLAELARCNLEPMLADWAALPGESTSGEAAGITAILDAWLRPLLRPAAFHAGGRALIVLDEIAAHGSAPASGEVMAAMVAISERVRTALRPHLPALDDATLRARLRFIAGAALGPPPRVPETSQTATGQTATGQTTLGQATLPQHDQLLQFAAAALR
jgi:AcrR family transcriptional regulator